MATREHWIHLNLFFYKNSIRKQSAACSRHMQHRKYNSKIKINHQLVLSKSVSCFGLDLFNQS